MSSGPLDLTTKACPHCYHARGFYGPAEIVNDKAPALQVALGEKCTLRTPKRLRVLRAIVLRTAPEEATA